MANGLTSNGIITNGSSGCTSSSWSTPSIHCSIYATGKKTLPSSGTYNAMYGGDGAQTPISVSLGASGGSSVGISGKTCIAWRVK